MGNPTYRILKAQALVCVVCRGLGAVVPIIFLCAVVVIRSWQIHESTKGAGSARDFVGLNKIAASTCTNARDVADFRQTTDVRKPSRVPEATCLPHTCLYERFVVLGGQA
jgi:hypothetical protein